MTPSSRSRMIASRCARDQRHPDGLVVEPLLVRLGRSAVARLGPHVARPRASKRARSWTISSQVVGIRLAELVEPLRARPRPRPGAPAPPQLLVRPAGTSPSRADDPGQGQPLADERGEDDAERQEDDQVAVGHVERQRERRGQRDHAAHPGPATTKIGAIGRGYGSRSPEPGAEQAREVGRREDPHDPRDDDRQADRAGRGRSARRRARSRSRRGSAGSCRPISRKTKPLIRKRITDQTPRAHQPRRPARGRGPPSGPR